MTKRVFRNIEVLLCLLTLFILFASFYFQLAHEQELCPLHVTQRTGVLLLFFITSTGVRLGTINRARLIVLCQAMIALASMYFAAKQLWWQSLSANEGGKCMPPLEILWDYFPWKDIFHAYFIGTCNCTKVSWKMFNMSMPGWMLLYFVFIILVSIPVYWRLKKECVRY